MPSVSEHANACTSFGARRWALVARPPPHSHPPCPGRRRRPRVPPDRTASLLEEARRLSQHLSSGIRRPAWHHSRGPPPQRRRYGGVARRSAQASIGGATPRRTRSASSRALSTFESTVRLGGATRSGGDEGPLDGVALDVACHPQSCDGFDSEGLLSGGGAATLLERRRVAAHPPVAPRAHRSLLRRHPLPSGQSPLAASS